MGKFSLENIIKDRLKGHEVHIDKRELWKSLGIEEEEKDRKVIWFWWIAGLFGLVLSAGLWWFVQKDGLDVSNLKETVAIEIDESIAKTGNETIAETTASEKLANIINDAKTQGSSRERDSNQPQVNSEESSLTIRNASSSSESTGESNRNYSSEQNELSKPEISTGLLNKNTEIEKNIVGNAVLNEIVMIEKLPQVNSLLTFNRAVESLEAEINPLIKPIGKTRKFEFELYAGAGTINRELSSSISEFENYISVRDSSESTLENVSIGMSLKYIIGGGFYGKAGFGVNRWNEKFSYSLTSDTTATSISIPEVILIDLQGNSTVTQTTEGTQISYTLTEWVRYNRLTQIDIPLSLGYEGRINRWSIFGEASAIFNVKQQFSGYLYNPSFELEEDPNVFRSSIGLNVGFNAGIGYGITPRIRARISARYYKSLGSVLLEDGLSQKYTSLGVRVGVGYLF